MKRALSILPLLLLGVAAPRCEAQGVVFREKKLLKVVDLADGGFSTGRATYTTILSAQLDGSRVVFLAYDGTSLEKVALFSADGFEVTRLLELGVAPLRNDVTMKLGEFRDPGPELASSIPLVVQTRDDFPRLALLMGDELVEVVDSDAVVPGTQGDHFTQFQQVMGVGDEVAFIGETDQGGRGVYLYSGGQVHDLTDGNGPDFPVAGGSVGERLIFDGETIYFSYGAGSVRDIYATSLTGFPSLFVEGSGEVEDRDTLREYEIQESFVGMADDLSFLAKIRDDEGRGQWALLSQSSAGLELLARSRALPPIDEKSILISPFSRPFFDGVSTYLGRINDVYGDFTGEGAERLLRLVDGNPSVNVIDFEAGNLAVIESGTTPSRLWAEIGVAGPVEIPIPPVPQAVALGAPATFEVTAEGAGPFTYQWFSNGRILPFSTTASLTLPAVDWDQVGTVSVVVTNALDSLESFTTLDLAVPPEITLEPADQRLVAGESAQVFFRTRGQRPIDYEIIGGPENSSFSILPAQSGLLFNVVSLRSSLAKISDSGTYTIRASNAAGSIDLSINLSVGAIPENSRYRGKEFRFLADHNDPDLDPGVTFEPGSFLDGFSFRGGVFFDESQDRFLTSRLLNSAESYLSISKEGKVSRILEGLAAQGFANPGLVGFLSDQGVIFKETSTPGGDSSLWTRKNGVNSLLLSSRDLDHQFGLGSSYSKFDFKVLHDEIVGLVEGGPGGPWAILKIGDEVKVLASDFTAPPGATVGNFLGCDDLLRPLFHVGFDGRPGDPTAQGAPRILRIELNGRTTSLSAGFLPDDLLDSAEGVSAISSHGGINYLGWGERLVEISGDRLRVHRLNETKSGQHLVFPDFGRAFATDYRVFFPAYHVNEALTAEEFALLNLDINGSDSIQRRIFAWTPDGVETVFHGRYLDGKRVEGSVSEGEPAKVLFAIGDQVLIGGRLMPEGLQYFRSYLMLNSFRADQPGSFRWNRFREKHFLDLPIGTRLMTSDTLQDGWVPMEAPAGSLEIQADDLKRYFRLETN